MEVLVCGSHKIIGTIITLLICVDDIILLARSQYDLNKHLRILQYYYSKMGIAFNTEKTKLMIIKFKKTNYNNFIYDNNCLEKIYSYKYLGIYLHVFFYMDVRFEVTIYLENHGETLSLSKCYL